ncbi:DedA family protein [Streptomyces sp. TP-A0874]|uniref:DedA family protein n=1 Tax=Streptomyces sp. TP-A0874 TaxID=549819 RepID=UPI00085351B8|nr:DedA family protein [Streptomyces sp. TP-A0874]
MNTITDWLAGLPSTAVYAVITALVFFEDALFFGFLLPGETAAIVGGFLASRHDVSLYWMAGLIVFASVVGDSVGYEVGRRAGPRVLATRALRRHRSRVDSAQNLVRRRGPAAVFIARYLAFFRAVMPALAGASHMRYRTFLLFNALGGVTWGIGFTLLGYLAGHAYEQVEHLTGQVSAVVIAVLVVALLTVWQVRRHRRGRRAEPQDREEDRRPPP